MIDRETALKITVSAGAVLLFVGIAIYASSAYGEDGHVTQFGGYVLVGAIAAFIVFISVAGFWLSRQEFDSGADDGDEEAA